MNDDADLLRQYADHGSEAAFAELVQRHLGLVYHAALRQTGGNAHRAQDVAQEVFTSLARKARSLAQRPTLAGWLHTSTRYAALQSLRTERRRQAREQEVFAMTDPIHPEASAADWEQLKPVVDDALHELNERDRDAVLLRYFEGRSFSEVGAKLAVTEDAARVRVNRALDKLRDLLARRGVTSTAAALSVALAHQAGAAVPAGLATTVTSGALAAGSGSAFFLTFMNLTKLKIALGIGVAAAGVATMVVKHQENQTLRAEVARLTAPNPSVATLTAENARLKEAMVRSENQRKDDAAIIQLLGEESGLKEKAMETALKRANASEATVARLTARLAEVSPYSMKELDRMPVISNQLPPLYPAQMKSAGVEGEALMEFVVDQNGAVTDVKAVRATNVDFEVAAEEALKQWKFNPGQKGGRAVSTRVTQLLQFKLPKAAQ